MKHTRLVVAALLAVALTGCGSSGTTTSSPSSRTSAGATNQPFTPPALEALKALGTAEGEVNVLAWPGYVEDESTGVRSESTGPEHRVQGVDRQGRPRPGRRPPRRCRAGQRLEHVGRVHRPGVQRPGHRRCGRRSIGDQAAGQPTGQVQRRDGDGRRDEHGDEAGQPGPDAPVGGAHASLDSSP